MKFFVYLLILAALGVSCVPSSRDKNTQELISVKNGQFLKGDKPYYFIGANYWYGPLLGSKSVGNRSRLLKELDLLKSLGIDNLRVLVGAEGGENDFTVRPALQYEQGKYDEDLLDGLDFFMDELRKRQMHAVLYLNNNWEWSGGMAQYLNWNGYGDVPIPNMEEYTWPEYMAYTEQFHSCDPCKDAFREHVVFIMGRTNAYNGMAYTEDNTIMSWQVANEPRVFSVNHETAFTEWLHETVKLMDSLDGRHLISTGSEGAAGYLWDIELFERTHSQIPIDYLTVHMWPHNWGWYKEGMEGFSLKDVLIKAESYLLEHIELARRLEFPVVMSEFGFPRSDLGLDLQSNTISRDSFYLSLFEMLKESSANKDVLAGYNFWGFGGYGTSAGRPEGKWIPGDDFMADPPQEPQGFNNVFAEDTSTLNLILKYNLEINK